MSLGRASAVPAGHLLQVEAMFCLRLPGGGVPAQEPTAQTGRPGESVPPLGASAQQPHPSSAGKAFCAPKMETRSGLTALSSGKLRPEHRPSLVWHVPEARLGGGTYCHPMPTVPQRAEWASPQPHPDIAAGIWRGPPPIPQHPWARLLFPHPISASISWGNWTSWWPLPCTEHVLVPIIRLDPGHTTACCAFSLLLTRTTPSSTVTQETAQPAPKARLSRQAGVRGAAVTARG